MWVKLVQRVPYTYSVKKVVITQMKTTCRFLLGVSISHVTYKQLSSQVHLEDNNSKENIIRTRDRGRKSLESEENKQTLSKELSDYFSSKESLASVLRLMPNKLLKRKKTPPEALYIVDKIVAKDFVSHLTSYIIQDGSVVIEANPGLGLLTKELLDFGVTSLQLYESSSDFSPYLTALQEQYDEEKIDINFIDIFSIWKLAFQDKMDNGCRMEAILKRIPKRNWTDAPAVKIVGSMPRLLFMKHLIFSIVFQKGIMMHGRPELYVTVPPALYIHLTCGQEAGYFNYRATSVLFQLFFESELLGKLPRRAFLPWESVNVTKKKLMRSKITSLDLDFLYLMKIVPRKDLYDCIPVDQLQPLWYFVRHHFVSRKSRVIPHLERWIPGCGTRVILKGLNIFTQFGDLTPQEVLSLFQEFASWPEYPHCPFLPSMETTFLKMEQGSDDMDKDIEESMSDDRQPDIGESEFAISESVTTKRSVT